MITFILLAFGAILVIGALIVAFTASQRKREGQSSQSVAEAQTERMNQPEVGRPTGVD